MKTASPIPPPAEVSTPAAPADGGLPAQPAGGLLPKSKSFRNILGQKFGRLTVVGFAGQDRYHHSRWHVVCECGAARIKSVGELRFGKTKSCGCLSVELAAGRCVAKARRFEGRRFGRLTALSEAPRRPNAPLCRRILCRCECGNVIEVPAVCLTRTKSPTRSCGCLRREISSRRATGRRGALHPAWKKNLTAADRARNRLGSPESLHFRALSKIVRRRDGHKCIVCGCGQCRLDVHHLEPWKSNPKLRFSPENLVTVCFDCHMEFHLSYLHDAGLEEFVEFMRDFNK